MKRLGSTVALALLLVCWTAASASAAVPDLFWEQPEDGISGSEAGRFNGPGSMAADQTTGHVFIADRINARIVELTAWGEFVKAWGWGVVATGPGNQPPQNEIQQLTVAATAGTFRLRYTNAYGGQSKVQNTGPIGFDWPATDPGTPGLIDSVQEALEDVPSLKAAPGSVTVSGGPGDAGGMSPYVVKLVGPFADKDVPPLLVFQSTLTGEATVQTVQDGGSFEVCVAADGDVCQTGQAGGSKPGEMPSAEGGGVAVDQAGEVYLYEALTESLGEGSSLRVQKFSAAGEFLAMWGGEVNKTKSAEGGTSEAERNLCTKAQVEAGDVCGTGVPGTGSGQFQLPVQPGSKIAVGPTGSIFVSDLGRIERFVPGGAFEAELTLTGEIAGEPIRSLAIDGAGNLYLAVFGKEDVRKLTPGGEEVMAFPASEPWQVVLDGSGNLYIVDREGSLPGEKDKVIAYEADGTPLIEPEEHFAESGDPLGGVTTSEACEIPGVDLYVSDVGSASVSAYGPAPLDIETCPPPERPPAIAKQFAKEVGVDSATVAARINPKFWNDTRYYLEYGTGKCSEGGCAKTQPLPPGLLLTNQVTQQVLATQGVLLSGLAAGTTYRYRFVAESGGGGPVFGVDSDGEGPEEASFAAGLEGSFKTRLKPPPEPDSCPNAGFRNGPGSRLPDCRAYEMVSPVDKENGDIIVLEKPSTERKPLTLNQSSPVGDHLSYSSYRAFGDAESASISSAYLAERTGSGWQSTGISPPRGRSTWEVIDTIDTQFKAFSADLCESWLINETNLKLNPGAPEAFANIYRRNNCGAGAGSYESLIPTAPPDLVPKDFIPELQGLSADGGHALFVARGKLTSDAIGCEVLGDPSTCRLQLYEALPGGGIRAVCILPASEGGEAAPAGCSAGSGSGGISNDGRSHMVSNAISADGSRIFWSDRPESVGRIFVRINGATSLPVSEDGEALSGSLGAGAQYWTAADDGSAAIFSVGSLGGGGADLYEYRSEGEATTKLAGKLYGLLGASEDASRVYLVSGEALDGAAVADEPNLYLYEAGEGGSFTFIAALSKQDAAASSSNPSPVNIIPTDHTVQVSRDGSHVAFMSSAPLTGYDNTDVQSGEADAEVFLYDAEAGKLRCVSCNPTNALPSGRDIGIWAAAAIPVTQTQLYQTPKVLSEDGSRLFFESFEALVGPDTNGKKDVYQWEAAGEGSCEESSPSFNEETEGCVELISSGTSEEDSSIVDISASGNDVFFATSASLLSQDPGLVDIYDARVGGGFPAPIPPPPFCEGEACQSPPAPPAAPTPSSASFRGPGNAKATTTPRKRCPKGRRKVRRSGKSRCVAQKRQRTNQERANHNGRAQR